MSPILLFSKLPVPKAFFILHSRMLRLTMLGDAVAMFARDMFIARTKWLAARATVGLVEDEQGWLVCHAGIADRSRRLPLIITAEANGTRELLGIQARASSLLSMAAS